MLANKDLQVFHFNEVHEIDVKAPVTRIWPLVREMDFGAPMESWCHSSQVNFQRSNVAVMEILKGLKKKAEAVK